jgi:hypothetical protein
MECYLQPVSVNGGRPATAVGKGYRFSTYAYRWIRRAIMRALADYGRTVRVAVHMVGFAAHMAMVAGQLDQCLGRELDTADIAEALDVPEQTVALALASVRQPTSLEIPVTEEGTRARVLTETKRGYHDATTRGEWSGCGRAGPVLAAMETGRGAYPEAWESRSRAGAGDGYPDALRRHRVYAAITSG